MNSHSGLNANDPTTANLTFADVLAGPGHPSAFHQTMTPGRPGRQFSSIREELIARRECAPKDIPSLGIISLAKSGSSLVNGVLKVALNLASTGFSWNYYDVVPGWARWVSEGGVVTHDHLWPSTINLDKLFSCGIPRVLVHYRDPRAAAVSRAHHSRLVNDQFIFESYATYSIPWILGWHELAEQHPARIALASYEELLADPNAYFDRVLDWFGVNPSYRDAVHARAAFEMGNTEGNNFRKGTADGWRTEISPELQDRLWAYTPVPLAQRLGMTR